MLRGWLDAAIHTKLYDPTAMVLTTVARDRAALVAHGPAQGAAAEGLVFYTNYSSRKAKELAGQEHCAVVFPWHPLQRQVRVEGPPPG